MVDSSSFLARLVARQSVTDEGNDQNIGSAQNSDMASTSASQLVSTLAPVALIAGIWLLAFLFLRRVFPRKYSPRSFVNTVRPNERTPALPNGLLNWFGAFFRLPDSHVLAHSSLDGYFFLRFLKIAVVICLVGCVITMPVLFAVNATGGGGQGQLDMLTIGNVTNNYYRYFAHAGCAYLFFGFVIFMITRESIFYINLRQAFLMSPIYAQRMSSRTVLYTSVPDYYLNEGRLRAMLGNSVLRIWLPTDVSELEDMVSDRDKISLKLEAAETKLGKLANAARLKSIKKGTHTDHEESALTGQEESGTVASRFITPKQRPTHRLKPLIGKKVDTINWSRSELAELIPKVRAEQAKHRDAHDDIKKLNAVFVEFDSVSEAQAAYQSLTHHQVLHMAPRYTGINPEEVIWKNLKIRWYERVVRNFATTGFVVALIVFWSIPVAVVGAISNINYLISIAPFLSFINSIPPAILGVVTGLLPSVMLAVLMALLPIVLRLVARISGDPTLSAIELTVQNYYFGFQVVQVFLVATLASSASAAVGKIIDNPSSVTTLLSTNIPKASNFYISYFILQGLAIVAGLLVGLVGLIIGIVLSKLLDSTPRKIYKRWTTLAGLGWGTVFPIYTNLLVIAICYACIAPLVLIFAAIGLYFFYLAYRYNLLFVYDTNIDTKGLVYPRALQQLFVGLYVAEVCLIGLFAFKTGESGGAIGALVLMIFFLIFTVVYNMALNSALGPLLQYLPKSLEAEERHLMELENGRTVGNGNGNGESSTEKNIDGTVDGKGMAPHAKPNFLTKFLKPHIYSDYETMRRMVPRSFTNVEYEPQVERDAFFHPSVTSEPMLLWIPRDPCGVSRQEVADTSRVISITDEGAHLDDKNKIVWEGLETDGLAPIHEEKIYY